MWALGETDRPSKYSSGAWLLRTSEEIDEQGFWTTWAIFFKRAFPVYLSSVMCSLFITLFAGCLLCPHTYGALSYTH